MLTASQPTSDKDPAPKGTPPRSGRQQSAAGRRHLLARSYELRDSAAFLAGDALLAIPTVVREA
jgi:hypothetical protein